MIRIAICDDERWYREKLYQYCREYITDIEYEIKEYVSAEDFISEMDTDIDILLLDVEMSGMDGISLKNILQQQRVNTKILFITSHIETMPEAFGSCVYGFLQKPVDKKDFIKKMSSIIEELQNAQGYIVIEEMGKIQKIFLKNILYIEAQGKYSYIHCIYPQDIVFSSNSIGEWEKELKEKYFAMSQRSYLVNLYYVKKIDSEIVLNNGERVPLSRRKEKEFWKVYRDYILEHAR